jgi:hypothetical protein
MKREVLEEYLIDKYQHTPKCKFKLRGYQCDCGAWDKRDLAYDKLIIMNED